MRTVSKLQRILRRHRDDERGAVLILTSMCMILLLGAGALGVDIGFTVWGSRSAQAMADTAALDLAQDIPTIDAQPTPAAMQSYITAQLAAVDTDNGSNAILSAIPGLWENGTFTPGNVAFPNGCSGTTYTSPPNACNAVEVSANQTVPQPFWGGFISPPGSGRGGSSGSGCGGPCPNPGNPVGVYGPKGGIQIGSYLAKIDPSTGTGKQQTAFLNVLLSKLGTSASVTAVGYQGLANTYVSLNQLITASGGLLTVSNVMTASLSGQQWVTILSNAVGNQVAQLTCGSSPTPAPCNAYNFALSSSELSTVLPTSNMTAQAQLCQMVSINGSTCTNGTVSTSALKSTVNLLQMLTTEAELANGTNALDVNSALGGNPPGGSGITGVNSASLTLTLIQSPAQDWGPVGSYINASPCPAPSGQTSTCAHTSQLSSDLMLNVNTVVPGVTATLDIPLSGAIGYATLSSVTCTNTVFNSMGIAVSVAAATGTVTLNGATLTTASVAQKNGSGSFTVVPPNPNTIGATPPNPQNPQNFGSTTPTVSYSPKLSLIPGLDATVSSVLGTVSNSIGPILQVAGASVGGAQVAATSELCDAVYLGV